MNTKKYFKEIFEANEKHDPVIDGIRALSVLSIIAFHIVVGIIQIYDHERAKQYILAMPSWLQPLWHGEKGVDAFFLLSALVIGIPFFKNIEKFDLQHSIVFLKKKLLRIYPLFFVALVLYSIAQWGHFGKYFFSNLFFLNNIIPGERTIIPVGWFLTVEVQYFILTPILFLLLKKIKYRGLVLTALFISSIAVCGAVLLKTPGLYTRPITDLFLAQDRGEFSNLFGRLFYESILTRYGPYVAGFLLAYLKVFYSPNLTEFFKNRSAAAILFITAAVLIIVPVTAPIYDPNSWFYQPFSSSLNFWTLITSRQIFAAGVALIILGGWYSFGGVYKFVSGVLSWRLWGPISKLSFPMYLFHFPFIAVAAAIIFGTIDPKEIVSIGIAQGLLIFLLAIALTFIFSIPFYLYIERPLVERGKNK